MKINEVKLGDIVSFKNKKGKMVKGKVIHRHDDSKNPTLSGMVNISPLDDKSYPTTVHVSTLSKSVAEEKTMKNVNEAIDELIGHIESGNNVEAEKVFNSLLQDRVEIMLDAAKQEVASSMFNTQECADCEQTVEEVEVANEALKGNQHKIDANKNGKIDAHDFKLLRGKKKGMKEQNMFTGYKKMRPSAETPETQKRRDALVKQKQAENEARLKGLKKKGLKISHPGSEGK